MFAIVFVVYFQLSIIFSNVLLVETNPFSELSGLCSSNIHQYFLDFTSCLSSVLSIDLTDNRGGESHLLVGGGGVNFFSYPSEVCWLIHVLNMLQHCLLR